MGVKELMLGDYVKTNNTSWDEELKNRFCKVEFIGHEYLTCVTIDGGERKPYGNEKGFEPIPITAEILEKNGFIKSTPPPGIHTKCYKYDNPKEKYNLTIADYNKYKRLLLNIDSEDSECFNIKCDYVHQLQHALRLCGIEKEIIL